MKKIVHLFFALLLLCILHSSASAAPPPCVTVTTNVYDTLCRSSLPFIWNYISVSSPSGNATVLYPTHTVGGCDSNVILHLVIKDTSLFIQHITICTNQLPYHWNGITVNSGGTIAATYITPNAKGCDSFVRLNLTVNPFLTKVIDTTICSNQSYSFNGTAYNTTQTLTHTYQNTAGCDSMVTAHLTVMDTITNTINASICSNQTYTFNSASYNTTQTLVHTFQNAAGCDSVVTVHLLVKDTVAHTIDTAICFGHTYTFNSQTYNTSQTITHIFQNVVGCDSFVTVHLTVNGAITTNVYDTICRSSLPFIWNNISVTSPAGNATTLYSAQSAMGCDSNVILYLVIKDTSAYTQHITICTNQLPYLWNGITVTVGGTNAATYITPNAVGCDSFVTLNLTVNPFPTYTVNPVICSNQTYTFNGATYNTTQTINHTFQNSAGCDSLVTVHLTVNDTVVTIKDTTICYNQSYSFNGTAYNTSQTLQHTFLNVAGCDSVVTIHLTVADTVRTTINATICSSQTYTFNGQNYNTTQTLTHTFQNMAGCDSFVTVHLMVNPVLTTTQSFVICPSQLPYLWNGITVTTGGTPAATFTTTSLVTGCDSSVTLNLNLAPAPYTQTTDTAACGSVFFNGQTYTSSTQLIDTLHYVMGCDSMYRVTNIIVHNNTPITQTIDTTACEQVYFEGNTYTQSTILHNNYSNVFGCDSLERTVYVNVNHAVSDTIIAGICNGETYRFNGQNYNTSGHYKASYPTLSGCDSSVYLNLSVYVLPNISIATPDHSSYCIGDTLTLNASGGTSYNWANNTDTIVFEGQELKTMVYGYNNLYLLRGTDAHNCVNTDSISITAQACCNIWMPNAFSPNGDGLNDKFKPQTTGHPKEYAMYIYDRWGKTVFLSFRIEEGWDGTENGKPANIDTYYWRIKGTCVNGEKINMKGDLTLVR